MYNLRLPPVSGYTKLFSSILHSTIWREPDHVRLVWITLLAMAGKTGVADTSIPGLADAARVPLEKCEDALQRLQTPDPYSRTGDNEGRRIEPVDGGWRLVNHGKYRAKMGADERREYLRVKQAERRAKKSVNTVSTKVNNVATRTDCDHSTEAEAYTDTKAVRTPLPPATRTTPLQSRRRRDAAFEGPRVYVPQRAHADFLAFRGGPAAQSELFEWYEQVSNEWFEGIRKADEPGADMFAFWKARYAERWPATVITKPDARLPKWAQDVKARQP